MLSNLHTHTVFCDGKNTAEEVVISAIEKGFSSIGFSGHGYTPFDLRYCMKDTGAYIAEINRLKEKYKGEIQVYLGIEEDAFYSVKREAFDYIIGSSHYFLVDGKYYPIDSDYTAFKKCLSLFDGDVVKLAQSYYENFCDYILRRKPDIVGHFDLITKFEEIEETILFTNEEYRRIAGQYITEAIKSDCVFEVNTGAMSKGYRKTPYPHTELLHLLKKNDARLTLTSDSHSRDTLDCAFGETRKMLKDIGFEYLYVLYDGAFRKDYLE